MAGSPTRCSSSSPDARRTPLPSALWWGRGSRRQKEPPMSIEATIRARRAIHLGHRVIAKDEVLARLTFKDRADAGFFMRRLGWSAFAVDLPKEPEAAPAPA